MNFEDNSSKILGPELLLRLRLLNRALEVGDRTRVRQLVNEEPQFNRQTGGEILWEAVLNDHLETAKLLVKFGVNLNLKNPHDKSKSRLLHELVKRKNPKYQELAMLIIKHGANVEVCTRNGSTPFDYATRYGSSIKIVKELLNRGVRVEYFHISDAAKRFKVSEVVTLLVAAFIKNKSYLIDDALHTCSLAKVDESRILPAVNLLLNKNFPIEDMTKAKFTLHGAIQSNKITMVKLLIKYGVDVNKPAEQWSPLYNLFPLSNEDLPVEVPLYAASKLKESKFTELLIEAGAHVNALSGDFNMDESYKGYAIHAACRYESPKNIQVLLHHGADIQVIDNDGRTPFSLIKVRGMPNDIHRMVMRHLAILECKGVKINDSDTERIRNRPSKQIYYTLYLKELKKMKDHKIIKNVSIFGFFDKNVREIAFLSRNCNFSKNYEQARCNNEFRFYGEEMEFAYKNAVTLKNLLSEKEKAICKSLKNFIPVIALERIIYYFYLDPLS